MSRGLDSLKERSWSWSVLGNIPLIPNSFYRHSREGGGAVIPPQNHNRYLEENLRESKTPLPA